MGANSPIYIQIANSILDNIKKGLYIVDSKIPTEDEIGKIFGVSRMTARNAVTYLVNRGILYRVHGSGTFVSKTKLERKLNKLQNFQEEFQAMNMSTSSKLVHFETRKATPREQSLLNIKNTDIFYVERIRYINGTPIGIQKFITPVKLVPNLKDIDLEVISFYDYLESQNIVISKADQRMESILAPEVSKLLGISQTSPYFYFERVTYDQTEVPVEVLESYFRGDMYAYSVSLFR